jgi:hypothetical protein
MQMTSFFISCAVTQKLRFLFMPLQAQHQTSEPPTAKGFTVAEKWIICSVFFLLLGLSTHLLVFPALLLISWSLVRWKWQMQLKASLVKQLMTLLVLCAGAGLLAWAVAILRH